MVMIGKEEAMYLRKRFPELKITRTCRQKSARHRYYVPETRSVMNALKIFHEGKLTE